MVSKAYLLQDQRQHSVESADFVDQGVLALGVGQSYLVIATGDIQRSAAGGLDLMQCAVRLSVFDRLGSMLAREEQEYTLDNVRGTATIIQPPITSAFRHGVISRHFSLMVAAEVPFQGGGGGTDPDGVPITFPPPRAILSARGANDKLAFLTNVRIAAFPADEVDVTTIQL